MGAWSTGLLIGLGLGLGLVALVWPGWGLVQRLRQARKSAQRARIEDTLKHLYESEVNGVVPTIQSVAWACRLSADQAASVLQSLEDRRLIVLEPDGIRLTASGRELGLHVLRAHRLWESYLADHTGFPETEWHGRAHDLEHGLTPAEVDALSARLQHPTLDPHGDPIPTATGEFVGPKGMPLATAPLDRALRILHIEDEPEAVYSQLVAVGLYPGMVIRLVEASPERVRVNVGGRSTRWRRSWPPMSPWSRWPRRRGVEPPTGEPLSALPPGESGRVLAVSRRCRRSERRRFLDLGVLPGTVIGVEMRSPNGDPTAYRIRDALIALRAEQAEMIRVERVTGQSRWWRERRGGLTMLVAERCWWADALVLNAVGVLKVWWFHDARGAKRERRRMTMSASPGEPEGRGARPVRSITPPTFSTWASTWRTGTSSWRWPAIPTPARARSSTP